MSSKYVLDANILFGAFISGKNIYKVLFTNQELYVPDFIFVEIEKYKETILNRTKIRYELFNEFVFSIMKHITVVPRFLIGEEAFQKAYKLCKDIDEKDTPYVALSVELNIDLITNDKKLYRGLVTKGYKRVITFKDFVDKLQKPEN